jgi:hypothetical protein
MNFGILLISFTLLRVGFCFSDGEKYFRIKSETSEEFSEFCIELNETSVLGVDDPPLNETASSLYIAACEDGKGAQIFNVDTHSRIHSEIPGYRAGCIFNVNNTLTYEIQCSNPKSGLNKKYAKFSYNLFDTKLMQGYKAMTIVGITNTGAPIAMKKPKEVKIEQRWRLDFVPLPEQLKLVNNPCGNTGECEICSGDCDTDSDCQSGLRCAQRTHHNGKETVPGCFWGEDSDIERFKDKDYCFLPVDKSSESIVNYVGECSWGNKGYKCKKCEGSCHYDSDCMNELKCFHRHGFEAVPGCDGEAGTLDMYGKGICYDPHLPSVSLDTTNCTLYNNCTKCSTCQNDDDCFGDLRCTDRETNSTVPGCHISTSTNPPITSDQNFCFKPLTFPGNAGLVNYVGECSQSSYKCGRCEGGCTTNDDCEGTLVCLERNATEHVPGCFHEGDPGFDMKGKNVCYDDPSQKELLWYGNCKPHRKCPDCAGGCQSDYECSGHLRCAKRYGIEDVPGCRWGSNASYPTFMGPWGHCFDPFVTTAPNAVRYIGECSIDIPGYLCYECEGNCRFDSDCAFDLQCMHRTGFENVPGCSDEGSERDMWGKGICFDPSKFA